MDTTLEAAGQSHASGACGEPARILLVVTAPRGSRVIELEDGAELTLGRSEPADLVLSDASVSRVHARVRREGELVRVIDLGSRNGTWLAGRRIEDGVVPMGAAVALGAVSICVQLAQSTRTIALGLMTSASVLSLLEEELSRSTTFGRPLCVMMVRATRRSGLTLRALSARCLARLRASDRVGLYDRGALLVVLPETEVQDAEQIAAELWESAGVTCGIAAASRVNDSVEKLVSAAWAALGRASEQQPAAVARERAAVCLAQPDAKPQRSAGMLELTRMVERLASRKISVLVLGETGSGKELVARELHERSNRKQRPLTIVNCGAIPAALTASVLFGHVRGAFTGAHRDQPGVFAQADGGTIFLDEVGELSPDAQAALLRVLDTRRIRPVGGERELSVDVRVIAATHRSLAAMAEQGTFRLDLYHRLNSVVLRVPALRERKQEIPGLARAFLQSFEESGDSLRISDEAMSRLLTHDWPGNVRELRNVMERAVALCDDGVIRECDLPHHLAPVDCEPHAEASGGSATELPPRSMPELAHVPDSSVDLRRMLRQQEISLIEAALRSTDGNQKRAATLLRLPLRTLERKLQVLGIRRQR